MKRFNPFYGLECDEEVDMDVLVKDEDALEDDYKEGVNKEVKDQDPDPDAVVKADLEMDPAAATEAFICKRFGLSLEDLEEGLTQVQDEAAAIIAAEEDPVAASDDPDDALVSDPVVVEGDPAETVVTVTPPAEGTTAVAEEPVVDSTEIKTASDVAALEGLHRLLGMEDGEDVGDEGQPDVSIDVETPNNDVSLDFEDKAITIEPNDSSDDVSSEPAAEESEPETESSEETEAESGDEEDESEGSDEESSGEAWFNFI